MFSPFGSAATSWFRTRLHWQCSIYSDVNVGELTLSYRLGFDNVPAIRDIAPINKQTNRRDQTWERKKENRADAIRPDENVFMIPTDISHQQSNFWPESPFKSSRSLRKESKAGAKYCVVGILAIMKLAKPNPRLRFWRAPINNFVDTVAVFQILIHHHMRSRQSTQSAG